jgi:peroxiredoxin
VAALTTAVAVGVVVARGNEKTAPVHRLASGPKAPSFEGKDPVTGRAVSLASFTGRPVVVNVWFSTCPGCNEEAGDLRTFDRRHPGVLLGIDVQDSERGAKDFYRRWGWRHPSVADPTGSIAARFGVVGFPSTYFLNARHEIVGQIVGATDLRHFEDGFRQAVAPA